MNIATKKQVLVISKKDILSAIAHWGIRQSPYIFPKNLEAALNAVSAAIDNKKIFPDKGAPRGPQDYAEITVEKLDALLEELIHKTPEVNIWNVTQVEQEMGITDPEDEKRTVKFGSADRHGNHQSEDYSFIDLYALHNNVLTLIVTENAQ